DFAWMVLEEAMKLALAFHPLVPYMERKLHQTREMACDELASDFLSDRRRYARSLLAMASHRTAAHAAVMTFAADDFAGLRERIVRLAAAKPADRFPLALAAAGLVFGAACAAGSLGVRPGQYVAALPRPAVDRAVLAPLLRPPVQPQPIATAR